MIYTRFEARRMRKLKCKSSRAKTFYPGVESKQEILSIQGLKPVKKIVYAKV